MRDLSLPVLADFTVGQRASFTRTITQEAVDHFIAITEDRNPLHTDESVAARTFFRRPIAHGMLTASLFSTMVGMVLPGFGAIYRSQTLQFLRPVYIGEKLTAWFEVTAIDHERNVMTMESWIENESGERVVQGEATVSLLKSIAPRS